MIFNHHQLLTKLYNFMKKPISLIAIASSQTAKIFEKIGSKKFDFNLICEMEAVLDSNHEKPGRAFNSVTLRHGIEPHTNRRQVEKHQFATKISQTLAGLNSKNHYDDLVIMGSHKMLEELEKTLNMPLKQKMAHRIPKDIVGFTNNDIKKYIGQSLIK